MTTLTHSPELHPRIATFLNHFYTLSDTESAHEEYATGCFTSPTHFQIGPMKPVSSHEEILSWRQSGWQKVQKRRHVIQDVFVHPDAAKDTREVAAQVMLYGFVEYDLRDGSKGKASWGGRMVLENVEREDDVKISSYDVWITPETP